MLEIQVHLHLSGLKGGYREVYAYRWKRGPVPAVPEDPYAGVKPGEPRGAKPDATADGGDAKPDGADGRTPSGDPRKPAPDDTALAPVIGTWTLDGNGYPGVLRFAVEGGILVGRLYYEVAKTWETLTDVKYVPATGELTFTRPWTGKPKFQQYRASVAGRSMRGTFTDVNSPGASFPWKATK